MRSVFSLLRFLSVSASATILRMFTWSPIARLCCTLYYYIKYYYYVYYYTTVVVVTRIVMKLYLR